MSSVFPVLEFTGAESVPATVSFFQSEDNQQDVKISENQNPRWGRTRNLITAIEAVLKYTLSDHCKWFRNISYNLLIQTSSFSLKK